MRTIREIVAHIKRQAEHIKRQAEQNGPEGNARRVAEIGAAKAAMQPTRVYKVRVYVDRVFTYMVVAEDEDAAWVIGGERYNADDNSSSLSDHIETRSIKTVVELAAMPQNNGDGVEPASEPEVSRNG